MTPTHKFEATFETLTELRSDIRPDRGVPSPGLPTLDEVLNEISPLPRGGLFVGMAQDGLPVLLNLLDPAPGPLLIVGDQGSGKTKLLQNVSQSIAHMSSTGHISYLAFTEQPAEWDRLPSQNCQGIHIMGSPEGTIQLDALIQAAYQNRSNQQIVAVLIDDLGALVAIDELRQYLRWLFLSGPAHQVWPFVSVNAAKSASLASWLGEFHTRLFGSIKDPRTAANLAGDTQNVLIPRLVPGSQFAMRDGSAWLPFWIPRLA